MFELMKGSGAVDPGGGLPSVPCAPTLRWLRRWGALAWASWLLSIGLLWWQHWGRILHPTYLLFIFLVALTFGSALIALGAGLWNVLRGPKRLGALAWLLVALLPVLGWVTLAWYAYSNGQKGEVPRNTAMILMMRAAHSLMEAEATYLYAHRLESQRIVMFYQDGLTDPEGDLQAMDRHMADMEERTCLPLRARIYWVRGPLLGRRGLCCFGVALGSNESPASELDRHELAHALMNQHYTTETDPPTLLSEGWAMSQQSQVRDDADLALGVWSLHEQLADLAKAPESEWKCGLARYVDKEGMVRLLRKVHGSGGHGGCYLRELTDAYWYHRDKGAVYEIGGAFVRFLLRKYGGEQFVKYYFACRPGTFEAECKNVFGISLDDLENEFWEDAKRFSSSPIRR
jgi:hypothetical protein